MTRTANITDLATEIVDNMNDEQRANYRRDDWTEAVGLWCDTGDDFDIEDTDAVLDAVDAMLAA